MNPVQDQPPWLFAQGTTLGQTAGAGASLAPAGACAAPGTCSPPDRVGAGPFSDPTTAPAADSGSGSDDFFGVIQTLVNALGSLIGQGLGSATAALPGTDGGAPNPQTGSPATMGPAPGRVYLE
jgi:hypothetical protein